MHSKFCLCARHQKRPEGCQFPLELEIIVNCHMHAENQTQALGKSSKYSPLQPQMTLLWYNTH